MKDSYYDIKPSLMHRWQVPLSETRYLRSHLRRHGVVVAWTPSDRLSQGTKEAFVSWYESLFAGIEEVNGNDNS